MTGKHNFRVFCRYNRYQFYVLCLLQFPAFQGLELLGSGLLHIWRNLQLFVILFRNTINSKVEPEAVLFQLIIALLGFFALLCQCCYLLLKEFLVWFQCFDFIVYFIFYFLQILFNLTFKVFKCVAINVQWVF